MFDVACREECLCSFTSPSLDSRVDDRNCNITCDPDGSEHVCGDRTYYNVFTTGLHTPRVSGDHYMGCYKKDDISDKKVEKNETDSHANSQSTCSKRCENEGFHYFQLTNRVLCGCTNGPPDDGFKIADHKCSTQCSGDANKYCGGSSETAAVFRIGNNDRLGVVFDFFCNSNI